MDCKRIGALRRCLAAGTLAMLLGGVPLVCGQTTTESDTAPTEENAGRRLLVGVRGSAFFTDLMSGKALKSSTADPVVTTTTAYASTTKRYSGGATLEYDITDRVAIAADVLYRRSGYELAEVTVEGLDDEDTDDDEREYTTYHDTTTATYWDIPLVVRFYNASRNVTWPRAFLEIGPTVRLVRSIKTAQETVYPDETTETDSTPATPENKTLYGAVFGGGFQFRSSTSSLRVTPEFRYTRWFGNTFDEYPAHSNRTQLEFLLGFTF